MAELALEQVTVLEGFGNYCGRASHINQLTGETPIC
jgi:hypothetical protein